MSNSGIYPNYSRPVKIKTRIISRNYRCGNCNMKGLHRIENCPKILCNRCGDTGHIGKICNNKTYLSLKYTQCGCQFEELRGEGFDTHCYICKWRTALTEMEISNNQE